MVSEGKVAVTDQPQECWYKSWPTVKLQVLLLAFRKINVGRVSNPVSSHLYRQTCARTCRNTRCFDAAQLSEGIHGIPEQEGLWFLRQRSSVATEAWAHCCVYGILYFVLQEPQLMYLVSFSTVFLLCFCMSSYHINFWCFTFYSLPTDLLKNISVQRPQIQYMFCTDTGKMFWQTSTLCASWSRN